MYFNGGTNDKRAEVALSGSAKSIHHYCSYILSHVALGDQVFSELTLLLVLSKDAPVCVYTHGGTRLSSSNHR